MATQMMGSTTTTAVARVNLLPPEIAEKAKVRRSKVLMVGTGLAAVAVVGVMYAQQSAKVADAEQAKADAVAAQAKLRGDLGKLRNVSQTYAQVDAAKATLASVMATEILWSGYLHDLTLRIPDNVWLTSLNATVAGGATAGQPVAGTPGGVLDPGLGTVQFSGTAFAHDDVAAWLESLGKQKGYANPYFTQSVEAYIGTRKVVNYTSRVNLTQDALSKRYTKGLAR